MNQILLVEGNNDKHFFWALFEKYKVPESFKTKDTEGIDNMLKDLPTYIQGDQKTIGIIIDADSNIKKQWESVKQIIKDFDYLIPPDIDINGTIIEHNEFPTIGIWIMPNNNENGMLENFVEILIPNQDKLIPFVDETLKSLEDLKLSKYKNIHKSKARIHTWLAWQENPGTPMGLAITKSYLDTNQELCNHFVKWINELFNGE